jgi:hypothetical protein
MSRLEGHPDERDRDEKGSPEPQVIDEAGVQHLIVAPLGEQLSAYQRS